MTLIVCLKKGRDRGAFIREAKRAGVGLKPMKGLGRHMTCEGYTPEDFPLRDHPAVLSVEDGDAKITPAATRALNIGADFTGANWGLARIVRRAAPWNVDWLRPPYTTYHRAVRDGTGVDIYLIDSRPLVGHDEFGGRLTEITTASASGGHGTSTNSLAGGANVGVAPGALLWNASWGSLSVSNITSAMGEILSHYSGRSGTNRPAVCSIALTVNSATTFSAAIDDLLDAGIVVCAAAGNDGVDLAADPRSPAVLTDVICCGAIGAADIPIYGVTYTTNYGERIDVSAPAQGIWTASVAGASDYVTFNGTSAAAPIVAGIVACMLQGKSRLTTRTQVQAVRAKVIANATTGRLRDQPQFGIPAGGLPDRIAYLDPDLAEETISGVT